MLKLIRTTNNLLKNCKWLSTSTQTSEIVFKTNLTPEEQSRVVSTLNHSNPEQLTLLNISQNRIKNFESWKNRKGPFKSLNEVLEVEGLSVKMLEKLCEKIISNQTSDKEVRSKVGAKRTRQLITPQLDETYSIKSAIGIHLDPTGISWARIQREHNKLTNWDYINFTELPKKILPNETFELALDIIGQIPNGDAYIFESNSNMPQGQSQSTVVTSYTQKLELTSMLLALLNTSSKHNLDQDLYPNRAYFIRSKLPARLFKTLVGNERVSALATIAKLFEDEHTLLHCTRISFDPLQFPGYYNLQQAGSKELLGQALMLIISFMDLCVYKNPVSFSAITPNRKMN